MLIKSKDKRTILNAGDIAGVEITRGKVYLEGDDNAVVGFVVSAILARYDGRIPLGGYATEDQALTALRSIEQWIDQGSTGTFELE